jgi:hypothetical protein
VSPRRTKEEALVLAREIADSVTNASPDADVALFVPYVFIEAAMGVVGNKLMIGAEVSQYVILCNPNKICYCQKPFFSPTHTSHK